MCLRGSPSPQKHATYSTWAGEGCRSRHWRFDSPSFVRFAEKPSFNQVKSDSKRGNRTKRTSYRTHPFKYTLKFKIIKHTSTLNRSFLPFIPSFSPFELFSTFSVWPLSLSLSFCNYIFPPSFLRDLVFELMFDFSSCSQEWQWDDMRLIRKGPKITRAQSGKGPTQTCNPSQMHVPSACPTDRRDIWRLTRSWIFHDNSRLPQNTGDVSREQANLCGQIYDRHLWGNMGQMCGSAMTHSCKHKNAAAVGDDLKRFNVSVNMGSYWPRSL